MTDSTLPDVKRLLEEATDLPWRYFEDEGEFDELQDGHGEMIASGFRDSIVLDGKPIARDAALIVYAVNRLPLYEEAASVLERFVESHDAGYPASVLMADEACEAVRSILSKLGRGIEESPR